MSRASTRRGYLDWLRGAAVLIMIASHTLDSWTRMEDRARPAYGWANMIAGIGAPAFLFLAGIAMALAAGTRMMKGASAAEAATLARGRAWQIFGLAFLFRLQAWVISGGTFTGSVLKVDILNVMGLSMLAAAILWGVGRRRRDKAVWLAAGACGAALITPPVRATPVLAVLPDPVEWYLRPAEGQTTFTLFPWSGFLLAGGALGVWLERARTPVHERRVNLVLAVLGPAIALAGYGASFLPAIYEQTSFWTSSPTFFFIRLGILVSALPAAYAWNAAWAGRSPLQELGVASLLIYWIHVEMVYGVLSAPIHRSLTFEGALAAFALFSLFLYAVARALPHVLPPRVAGVLRRGGFLPAPRPG